MKLLSTLGFLLLFLSSAMAETAFDKILEAKGKEDASFELQFDDGFKQIIKGPIEIEEGPAVRCPCTIYHVTFTDGNGQRVKRKITVQSFGGNIEYEGGDGTTYYIADIVKPGERAKEEEPVEVCALQGKMKMFSIKTRKAIPDAGKSCPVNGTVQCLGEEIVKCEGIAECNNHPEYGSGMFEIYCISKNGRSCPSAMDCISDTAYDEYEKEAEQFGLKLDKEVKNTWEK